MSARSSLACRIIGFGVLATLVSYCGDSTGVGVQPEIRNIPDSFEFQVTDVAGLSRTLEYSWSNSGTRANVNQSAVFTAGSAQLVLLDAAGTQVYTRSLAENGTFASSQGVAGTWKVRVVFTNASGTLNFRVQKP